MISVYRKFSNGMLVQLIESVGDPSKEAWIAVDFDGDASLPRDFALGDAERSRNNFINRPLRTAQTYRVFVHARGQGSVNRLVHHHTLVLRCPF